MKLIVKVEFLLSSSAIKFLHGKDIYIYIYMGWVQVLHVVTFAFSISFNFACAF